MYGRIRRSQREKYYKETYVSVDTDTTQIQRSMDCMHSGQILCNHGIPACKVHEEV